MIKFDATSFPFDSSRLTFDGELNDSKREILRDQIAFELEAIQTENGYRTDPYVVLKGVPTGVTSFPTIAVIIGQEDIQITDAPANVFTSRLQVEIRGYYSDEVQVQGVDVSAGESAGEAVLDDIKRIWSILVNRNVNSSVVKWHIDRKARAYAYGPIYSLSDNSGHVGLVFTCVILAQGSDF